MTRSIWKASATLVVEEVATLSLSARIVAAFETDEATDARAIFDADQGLIFTSVVGETRSVSHPVYAAVGAGVREACIEGHGGFGVGAREDERKKEAGEDNAHTEA